MKKKEFVRNPYNYDADELSNETGLLCLDETLTEQQHIEEADINYIAERFMRTGEMPQLLNMPTSGDFDETTDFQSAMNVIAQAKQEFMALPAKMRTRFNNDPAELIAFLEDEENRPEAIKLGLVPKPDNIAAPLTLGADNERGSQSRPDSVPKERPGTERTQGNANPTETTQKPGSKAAEGDRGRNTG